MFLIILPMFIRMKLPWRKKIPLIGVFGLGLFTILSAVLNKWYSFTQPFGAQWTYWYTRESSTALLVANLPFVWTIYRKITGTKSIKGTSRHDSLSPQDALSRTENGKPGGENEAPDSSLDSYEMKDAPPRVRQMTFSEMLSDGNPSAIDDQDVDEITHPALFYTKGRGDSVGSNKHQSATEKMAMEDMEFQTVAEGANDRTPTSSQYPSLKYKESANSFV